MKNYYLLLLLSISLLCASTSQAQSDTLFIDTVEINVPFQQMVDSCFEHVNLNEVPTGLLLEKAYATFNTGAYDVKSGDNTLSVFLLVF